MHRLYFLFNPTEGDPDMWADSLFIIAMITLVLAFFTILIPFFLRYKRNAEVRTHRIFFGIAVVIVVLTQIIFCILQMDELRLEGGAERWLEIIFSALIFSVPSILVFYLVFFYLPIKTFSLRKYFVKTAISFGFLK